MHHFRILLPAVVCLLFTACETDKSSFLTAEQYLQALDKAVSEDELLPMPISSIDPYESYFLALTAYEKRFFEISADLTRYCWKSSDGFIAERAAELAVRIGMETGNYASAEFFASIAAAEFPGNYIFARTAAAAEYWQREDDAVIQAVDNLSRFPDAAGDFELYLFRAVSSYRTEAEDWEENWIRLMCEVPSSDYIRRGWDYLSAVSDCGFDDFGLYSELFEAKYYQSTEKYSNSASAYRRCLTNESIKPLAAIVLSDIEKVFIRIGAAAEGAELIETAGAGNEDYIFTAARLYRRAGRYSDAERCMRQVLDIGGRSDDRALWYSLDITGRINPVRAVGALDFYSERWTSPEYFTDTLDRICTSLAGRRRWQSIADMALKLEKSGPAAVYDRCRYISERASELGWIEQNSFSLPYSGNYYRILSEQSVGAFRNITDEQLLSSVCKSLPEELSDAERYIEGLLRYGADDLLEQIKRYEQELSERFLSYIAGKAADSGMHLDSIRIMYQYNGSYSAAGYASIYPDLYRNEIEQAAEDNNIPVQLLYGLVWKESAFENEIVSRSGAIGLSQLMPSTAEDVARRQRKSVGDLTDPAENLSLGSWYLDWLRGYVGNTSAAVLSYNGGPGRVRSWMRKYPDLPEDLLYEIVPVAETHNYGKKVLEAAVVYGLLYYGVSPSQTLEIFFQENS